MTISCSNGLRSPVSKNEYSKLLKLYQVGLVFLAGPEWYCAAMLAMCDSIFAFAAITKFISGMGTGAAPRLDDLDE